MRRRKYHRQGKLSFDLGDVKAVRRVELERDIVSPGATSGGNDWRSCCRPADTQIRSRWISSPFNVASIFLGKARLNPSYAKGAFGPFQSAILAIFREITARWAMSSTGT